MNNDQHTNYVIFAAGVGSRLGRGVPKFVANVLDRPLCDWVLPQLVALGGRVFIVCGHQAELVVQTVARWYDKSASTHSPCCFIFNPNYLGPQAISIAAALQMIDRSNPTYFIDGDLIMSSQTLQSLQGQDRTTALVRRDLTSDPVFAEYSDERLIRFARPPIDTQKQGDLEWANIIRYQPRDLELLSSIALDTEAKHHFHLINQCVQAGSEIGLIEGELCEIDNEVDLQQTERFLQSHQNLG